uniref:Uncharacterized protein n=1 Tax=Anguilla anguilla TaxID=7936 RepID=A0A0E9WPX2_ANGAN
MGLRVTKTPCVPWIEPPPQCRPLILPTPPHHQHQLLPHPCPHPRQEITASVGITVSVYWPPWACRSALSMAWILRK